MQSLEFYRNIPNKECRECGEQFIEQAESYIYECERCFGKTNE